MTLLLDSGRSGRDHYADLYRHHLEREAEWLQRTSGQKVASIALLLNALGLTPASVLEVGAGTGAVIGGLRRSGIGESHYAVDYSPDAIKLLRKRESGVQATVADITEQPDPFGIGVYDLVVASHVVEHLEAPEVFLKALHAVPMRHLVVEVPLENLALGRLKAQLKDRTGNAAGHVQFFSRRSFEVLLQQAGWNVERVNVYAPRLDADTFRISYGDASPMRKVQKALTELVLPRLVAPLWTRVYHAHCTALCTRMTS